MRSTVRRPLFDFAMAAGGVVTVVACLAIMDERVRRQVADLTNRQAVAGEVSSSLGYVKALALVIFQAIQDRSIDHAPLMIFTVAAVGLVFFLVRTRI